jgi:hypothetical protein
MLAAEVRRAFGLDDVLCIPIVQLLEFVLPEHWDWYDFDVLATEEMGEEHGRTFPDEGVIQVREDIYGRALKGIGRDRGTMAHEFGHLLMHRGLAHSRVLPSGPIAAFRDPEWQAKCFQGEFLVNPRFAGNFWGPEDVAEKCGVSADSAEIVWQRFQQEGTVRKK